MEIVYERVAGIDVHKRQITVAIRALLHWPIGRSGTLDP
jgi:hypothetical protein